MALQPTASASQPLMHPNNGTNSPSASTPPSPSTNLLKKWATNTATTITNNPKMVASGIIAAIGATLIGCASIAGISDEVSNGLYMLGGGAFFVVACIGFSALDD